MSTFFHFTAQGLTALTVIATLGWKILAIMRRWDHNFAMIMWQHEVMWNHHKQHNEVPAYPSFIMSVHRKHARFEKEES